MEQVRNDIDYLSNRFEHRHFATDEEEAAASYVLKRLMPWVDDAHKVNYNVVSNMRFLRAAYLGEFSVVGILALWWPSFAFFYGLVVFLAYLAEHFGYPVFSRFMSTFESTAVVGSVARGKNKNLLVFTAYLDTNDSIFNQSRFFFFARHIQFAILSGMVLMLATCAIDIQAQWHGGSNLLTDLLRGGGIGLFAIASLFTFAGGMGDLLTRGANHNASGIAALLRIAEKLHDKKIENASVVFYFPGGHYANMGGMRMLLAALSGEYEKVYLINVEGVGAGELCFTASEGVLRTFSCSKLLVQAAERCAVVHKARRVHLHSFFTNAYLPLVRGTEAISIMGLDDRDLPVHYGADNDILENINTKSVLNAADMAESMARDVLSGICGKGEA